MHARDKTAWPPGAKGLLTAAAVVALTVTILLGTLATGSPVAAQQDNQSVNDRSGTPVEVIPGGSGEGKLASGDVLFVAGEKVPAKGASVTLTDEDGTQATLTDGENASLIPGASGMGMMVEGEPAEPEGGDGELSASGLRMTGSEDVVSERPESANLESAEAGSKEDETAGPLADSETIKQQVREQIDAGMNGGGSGSSPDTGSTGDRAFRGDSSGGGAQSGDDASGPGDTGSSGGDDGSSGSGGDSSQPGTGGGSAGTMDRECFPFCESGPPGDTPETSGEEDDDNGGGPSTTGRDRGTDQPDNGSGGGDGSGDPGSSDGGDDTGGAPDFSDMIDRGTSPDDTGTSDEDTSDESTTGDDSSSPDESTNRQQPDDGGSEDDSSRGESPQGGNDSGGDDDSGGDNGQGNPDQGNPDQGGQQPNDGGPRNDGGGGNGSSGDPYADLDLANPACSNTFNGVQTHVQAVGCEIFSVYGQRDYSGFRQGDPQDHGKGLALDYMVYDDTATGDAIAADALSHWNQFGMKYLIWQQRINFGSGWEYMEDRGSPTANHMDHPHYSHEAQAAAEAA